MSVWLQPVTALISAMLFPSRSSSWITRRSAGFSSSSRRLHQLAGGHRVVRGDGAFVGRHVVDRLDLILGEIRPAEFRAALLGAQLVDAGGHRDARDPVRKRNRAPVLVKSGEHLHKHLLGEVFLGDAARQVGAHNADDNGVQMFDQFACSNLIAATDAIKTANHIKRLVARHGRRNAGSNTSGKTPFDIRQLQNATGAVTMTCFVGSATSRDGVMPSTG